MLQKFQCQVLTQKPVKKCKFLSVVVLIIEECIIYIKIHYLFIYYLSVEHIPAFFHTYQYVKGKRVGIIKFSEPLTNLLSREPVRDTLHPRLLPMIVHPRPWLSYNSGGYLSAKSSCMRIKDSPEQLVYLHKASEQDRINAVLAGLDVLGSTQWRVNTNVFNVVLEAWNTGEAIADIPRAIEEHAPLPPKPENYDTDPKAKFNWVNMVKQQQTDEKNKHSLRCDVNYKVETARAVSFSLLLSTMFFFLKKLEI